VLLRCCCSFFLPCCASMFMTFHLSCDPSFAVSRTCLYVGVMKTGPPYWHFFRPRRKKIEPFSVGHSGRPSEESKGFLLALHSARPSREQGSPLVLHLARPSREQGPPLALHSVRPSKRQVPPLVLHSVRPSREQGPSRALHSARQSKEQGSGAPRLIGP